MRITISGTAGSGKGTLAKMLSEKYNLSSYDLGDIKREEAKKRGMTINEFDDWSKDNPLEGDKAFDDKQAALGKSEDNFVMVGRLSWYFIPHSFKIYLKVAPADAGKRIFAQIQAGSRVSENYQSEADAIEQVQRRNTLANKRYEKLYNLHFMDESHYDFVLDTTNKEPKEAFELIVKKIEELGLN